MAKTCVGITLVGAENISNMATTSPRRERTFVCIRRRESCEADSSQATLLCPRLLHRRGRVERPKFDEHHQHSRKAGIRVGRFEFGVGLMVFVHKFGKMQRETSTVQSERIR